LENVGYTSIDNVYLKLTTYKTFALYTKEVVAAEKKLDFNKNVGYVVKTIKQDVRAALLE